jgi:NADP-dependent 3-hydroxy acid dehydrogenase YdfG
MTATDIRLSSVGRTTEQLEVSLMRIFVTGASGWIGSAVVPELIGAGHQVVGPALTHRPLPSLRLGQTYTPARSTISTACGMQPLPQMA